MKTRFQSDSPRPVKSFSGRARLILQLEVGMERSEVQWHVWSQMRQNPFRKLAGLRRIIIQGRNHQVRNFEPHFCFVLQPFECLQNRLQMRKRSLPVETLRESFEIDV